MIQIAILALSLEAPVTPIATNQDHHRIPGFTSELEIFDPFGQLTAIDRRAIRVFPGDDVTFTHCPPVVEGLAAPNTRDWSIVLIRGSWDIPTTLGPFVDTVRTRRVDGAVVSVAEPSADANHASCSMVRVSEQPEGDYRLVALPTALLAYTDETGIVGPIDRGVGLDIAPPRSDSETLFMHYRRGRRAAMNGQWTEALEWANRLLALDRTATDGHLLKIEVLAKMGRTQEALQALELAGRRLPDPEKQTKLRRAVGPNSREDFCWIARRFLDLPIEDDCTPRRER
jgi:hypothetical protein